VIVVFDRSLLGLKRILTLEWLGLACADDCMLLAISKV
jgi:hypothetical protein